MTTTDWTPELTLNHDTLDPEHVAVFRLLGEACDAAGAAPAELSGRLAAFAEALVAHLRHEENVMEEVLYPDRARHKTSHDLLVADVLTAQAELEAVGVTPRVVEAVTHRIPEWLRFHTRVNDGPLGEYLIRRGPNPTPEDDPTRRPEGARRRS
jgi:hemerythrin-like metal-binding protein